MLSSVIVLAWFPSHVVSEVAARGRLFVIVPVSDCRLRSEHDERGRASARLALLLQCALFAMGQHQSLRFAPRPSQTTCVLGAERGHQLELAVGSNNSR